MPPLRKVLNAILVSCHIALALDQNMVITKIPNRQVYSGESVSLLCTGALSADDKVAVNWYNGTDLMEESSLIHISTSQTDMTFNSIIDIGLAYFGTFWYTCAARTEGPIYYDNIQIVVKDTGQISSLSIQYPNTSLYAGVPFDLTCLAKAPSLVSMAIQIKWTKNGSPLPDSSAHDIEYINTTAVLSRLTVNESHPGVVRYACSYEAIVKANTIFELIRATPNLTMQAFPSPELKITSIPAEGPKFGISYTLTCTVQSNVPAEIAWLNQNGDRIENVYDERISIVQNNVEGYYKNLSLVFDKVLPEDSGVYHCSVVLMLLHQNVTKTTTITVTTPAQVERIQIQQVPHDTKAWRIGENTALLCYVKMSRPGILPAITWRNSNRPVYTNDSVRVLDTTVLASNLVLSVLEFVSLQAQSQLYYCNAYVEGVGTSIWHHVQVNKLPQANVSITSNSIKDTITAGNSLSLFCTVKIDSTFSLPPDITWQRAGVDITNSSSRTVWPLSTEDESFARSVIKFTPVILMDSGKYTCTVTFKVADVQQSIQVQASYHIKLKVPKPFVSISPMLTLKNGAIIRKLTCSIMLTGLQHYDFDLSTSWSISIGPGVSILSPQNLLSDIKVKICNKMYSQDMFIYDTMLPPEATAVACEVNISITNPYIDGSSTISTLPVGDILSQNPLNHTPYDLLVIQTGNYWAQVQWTSAAHASFQVMYGEIMSQLVQSTKKTYLQSRNAVLLFQYSALLTNLKPATQYWYTVVASVNGINISSINQTLYTREAVPTGSPRNFTLLTMDSGKTGFIWQPPDKKKLNGNITSYKLHCTSPLESKCILTEENGAEIDSNILGNKFTCRISAISEEGEGPSSTLQVTFQTTTSNADNQESTLIQLYIIAGEVITCLIVIFCTLAVAVCCYKRKVKTNSRRHEVAIKASSSLYSITRASLTGFSNSRYVSSDEAQRRWNQTTTSNENQRSVEAVTTM